MALLSSLLPDALSAFLLSNWLFIFLSLLPVLYWYSTRNFDYWVKKGIKSPPATPFLGNFFSLTVPFPLLYKGYLEKYGKIFGVFISQKPQLIVAEPEIIKRILVKDFHLFRNRPGRSAQHRIFGQNLVAARNEEWKRIRSILTPMFTSLKLKKMEGLMENCSDSLLTSLEGKAAKKESFEARDPMGNFTMDVISKTAFATETNAHAPESKNVFLRNAKAFFVFSMFRTVAQMLVPSFLAQWSLDMKLPPLHLKQFDFFESISRALIKERKEARGSSAVKYTDMLQLMVNAEHNAETLEKTFKEDLSNQVDGHHVHAGSDELEREAAELKEIIGSKYLSEEEIMAQAMVFFLAGYETTASTLSYTLFELAVNPAIQERLYAELVTAKAEDPSLNSQTLSKLPYLDAVLSEALRKYPPALILAREANEDYYIPEIDFTLKAGRSVAFPVYAIHHRAEFFPNPEVYDPERFSPENRDKIVPYTYLPFGGGPRNCIGMRFALTEAKMGLARILERFRVVRTPETPDQLTIMKGNVLLKTSPINLKVEKRI